MSLTDARGVGRLSLARLFAEFLGLCLDSRRCPASRAAYRFWDPMIEVPEPLLDIARTTARLPRRPRSDANRRCSSNVASTFAAAG
jgi:hypothetical protein